MRERIGSERYYDAANRRLVYIGQSSTPAMWDDLWTSDEQAVRDALRPGRGTKWLVRLTRRYLPTGDVRVLEGGSGLGHNVAALRRAGYRICGIDFAPRTVAALHRVAPELSILLGDLRALPFIDGAFSGYWSLGVIEHFYGGYDVLAKEMARVIQPGGFLFLTFPYMSPLRRLRARFGRYRRLESRSEPVGFYQFALDAAHVAATFARFGFRKRHQTSMSGLQGLKDETNLLKRPLQALEDYGGRFVPLRGIRFSMEGLAALGAGHSCVLVLQKEATAL